MKPLMGPVLRFRGATDALWSLSALAVYEAPDGIPPVRWSVGGGAEREVRGTELKAHGSRRVVMYAFDVPRTAEQREVVYHIEAESWRVYVPARDAHPRMAFASCNGFSDPRAMRDVAVQNERWLHMRGVHAASPLHLLLLGGDQVYADSIWTEVDSIEEWNRQPTAARVLAAFTPTMEQEVEAFYFDLYRKRWAQSEVREMWASVPTLMTWDDHDIFDGWGSYDTDLQGCKVYEGIFAIARDHFRTFQLQTPATEAPPGLLPQQKGFSFGHRIGDVVLLFLDTRSERTRNRILGLDSWNGVFQWIDALGTAKPPPRHLMIVTPVPVLYPTLRIVEWASGLDPRHEQKRLEDDLRDHWTSPGHAGERKRLIQRTLDFAGAAGCRVTFVSGDVHVAALGILESDRHADGASNANVINQLVASPVVHVPPGGLVRWALEKTSDDEEEIERGIRMRMVDVPGRKRRIVNQRNWLEIDVESKPDFRIWANWHFEGETAPSTKVVHPVVRAQMPRSRKSVRVRAPSGAESTKPARS